MSKLTTLTLSNIRRFGPHTSISFSPGATVILAPNGTGKTAIFEAIELAMTGQVSRLGEDLNPIIRDSSAEAEVNLCFDGGQRAVHLNRNGSLELSGSLDALFGNTDSTDLPFLLRLTHLLDQRERDWFVQADAKVAGSQLSKLPIGRDGSQASSALVGARRYIKDQFNQVTKQVNADAVDLEEWLGLLRDRDATAEALARPLKSQIEIANALGEIASATQSPEPSALFSGFESLENSRDGLHKTLVHKLQRVDSRLRELTTFTGSIGSFESDRERVVRLEQDRTVASSAAEAQRLSCARLAFELTQQRDTLRERSLRRSELAQQISRLTDAVKAKSELDQRTHEFGEAGRALAEAEVAVGLLREKRQTFERLLELHNSLTSKLHSVSRSEKDFANARLLVARWQTLSEELAKAEEAVEVAELQLQDAGRSYQDAIAEHARKERAEAEARSRFQAFSQAADSVRQAVSMVAEHLGVDRCDCPVCGTVFDQAELRVRVQNSLEAMDPALVMAEHSLHTAGEELRKAEGEVDRAKLRLHLARITLSNEESQHSSLANEIDGIRSSRLVNADSLELALESLNNRFGQLASIRNSVSAELENAPVTVSLDQVQELNVELKYAVERLDKARKLAVETNVQLDKATGVYAALSTGVETSKALHDISAQQNELSQEIFILEEKVVGGGEQLTRQEAQLVELEARTLDFERQLTEARSRMAFIRASWQQLKLPGDPSVEVASTVELQLTSQRSLLDRHITMLEDLEAEIAQWGKAEQSKLAQSIIDRRRGALSEGAVTERLQKSINSGETTIGRLSKLTRAFESLSSFLSAEIGNIHDHVLAVVPRWQALLKRIVRDQRFAHTELSFYSHYNKEHASVLVPLHGGPVPAPSVASEAQMTDLQLTFLLSMAVNHHWSNWRGLLLDDPTQHHDLVHAAAVFDVLRDYVVDHGFQVVIATHDALQARFFMRKLQNDGIPSQLWSLVPTVNGVTAVANKF